MYIYGHKLDNIWGSMLFPHLLLDMLKEKQIYSTWFFPHSKQLQRWEFLLFWPLHFSTSTINDQIALCDKCFPILLLYYYGKSSRRKRLRTDPGGSLPGFRSLLHYQVVVNSWAGYSNTLFLNFLPKKTEMIIIG